MTEHTLYLTQHCMMQCKNTKCKLLQTNSGEIGLVCSEHKHLAKSLPTDKAWLYGWAKKHQSILLQREVDGVKIPGEHAKILRIAGWPSKLELGETDVLLEYKGVIQRSIPNFRGLWHLGARKVPGGVEITSGGWKVTENVALPLRQHIVDSNNTRIADLQKLQHVLMLAKSENAKVSQALSSRLRGAVPPSADEYDEIYREMGALMVEQTRLIAEITDIIVKVSALQTENNIHPDKKVLYTHVLTCKPILVTGDTVSIDGHVVRVVPDMQQCNLVETVQSSKA